MKIRVINPLPFTQEDFSNWRIITQTEEPNSFHSTRYSTRRKIIEKFISDTPDIDIEIHNAVTPRSFKYINNRIEFKDRQFEVKRIEPFYWSNLLSHWEIWNIEEDTLILEDDVIFDRDIIKNIENEIDSFDQIDLDGKVLNLSRSVPWLGDFPDKRFQETPVNEKFSFLVGGDLSGTGALYVPKKTKKILLENMLPICGCDAYFDILNNKKIVTYLIPQNKELMFRLDRQTAWLGS